jgi:hypothetical protein
MRPLSFELLDDGQQVADRAGKVVRGSAHQGGPRCPPGVPSEADPARDGFVQAVSAKEPTARATVGEGERDGPRRRRLRPFVLCLSVTITAERADTATCGNGLQTAGACPPH